MKTPAPQRAAGRRKLAAKGQTMPGTTSFPTPDVTYWHKALRSVGRVPAGKRPALASYLKKRAKQLGISSHVKGTWLEKPTAAAMANGDAEAITLAATMSRRLPMVRGAADVQMRRTGPGAISVQHKSTGMGIGSVVASGRGYAGVHADGTKTPASGSQQGALAGLIEYHNRKARNPAATMTAPTVKAMTSGEQMALDLAGAMPRSTPAVTSGDGPRVTTVSGAKVSGAAAKLGLSAEAAKVYAKLRKKGLSHGAAMSMAKRAATMSAKAAA